MKFTLALAATALLSSPVSADPLDGNYVRTAPWAVAKSPLPTCGELFRKTVDQAAGSVSTLVVRRESITITGGEVLKLTSARPASRLYGVAANRTMPDGKRLEVYMGVMITDSGQTVIASINSIDGVPVCSDGSIAPFKRK